jgi:hypothetical protein
MLLGMLGLAIVWLVGLRSASRRSGGSGAGIEDTGYLAWLYEDWVVLGAGFFSICIALLIVMGLARRLGERWWLPGAAVFVGIAALHLAVRTSTSRRSRSRARPCSRPRRGTRTSSACRTSRHGWRR